MSANFFSTSCTCSTNRQLGISVQLLGWPITRALSALGLNSPKTFHAFYHFVHRQLPICWIQTMLLPTGAAYIWLRASVQTCDQHTHKQTNKLTHMPTKQLKTSTDHSPIHTHVSPILSQRHVASYALCRCQWSWSCRPTPRVISLELWCRHASTDYVLMGKFISWEPMVI